MKRFRLLSFLLVLLMTGCSIGPGKLRTTTGEYNRAVRALTDEQLLLNLVRLKYRESVMFLEISNITAQFSLDLNAGVVGTINENVGPGNSSNPDALELSGSLGYADKPTLSFFPLQGEKYVTRLMSPIEIETLMMLYYSGWSVDRVLRTTVQRINNVENAMTAAGPTPDIAPPFRDFARLTRQLRRLQLAGSLDFAFESKPTELSAPIAADKISPGDLISAAEKGVSFRPVGDDRAVLTGSKRTPVIRVSPNAAGDESVRDVLNMLNLEPGLETYEVQRTFVNPFAREGERFQSVAVSTRSLIGTLFYLAQGVQVPEEHIEAGEVTITQTPEGEPFDWRAVTGDLLRIRSSERRPKNPAVAARYRGYWFYIDDNDLNSKSTFALLGQLFSLQAGDQKSAAPVLTLPLGG